MKNNKQAYTNERDKFFERAISPIYKYQVWCTFTPNKVLMSFL